MRRDFLKKKYYKCNLKKLDFEYIFQTAVDNNDKRSMSDAYRVNPKNENNRKNNIKNNTKIL